MKGAGRVFAREFQGATLPMDEGVLSPFGFPCGLLFVAGALIELESKGPDFWTGRVADPSGVFEFRTERPDASLRQSLMELIPPSFVTVLAGTRSGGGTPPAGPTLALIEIGEADRYVRDSWILRTAELTIERLARVMDALRSGSDDIRIALALSHYKTTESDVREMAEVVRHALATVSASTGKAMNGVDVKERVLAIIRESAGKSGISLDAIIDAGGQSGITADKVREAVRSLIEEDECYQPAKGIYKPL
jgi:RPA family protein